MTLLGLYVLAHIIAADPPDGIHAAHGGGKIGGLFLLFKGLLLDSVGDHDIGLPAFDLLVQGLADIGERSRRRGD